MRKLPSLGRQLERTKQDPAAKNIKFYWSTKRFRHLFFGTYPFAKTLHSANVDFFVGTMKDEPLQLSQPELLSWLKLTNTDGIGVKTALRLLRTLGPPEKILSSEPQTLLSLLPEDQAQGLLQEPTACLTQKIEQTYRWLETDDHHILPLTDPRYPRSLLALADPPLLLYVNGDIGTLAMHKIAIVGTRNASDDGLATAYDFGRHLAAQKLAVVSGLAAGIDGAAHRGALETGTTIAVLGTGMDQVYPREHRNLAQRIAAHGALISELPLMTPVRKHHFPQRNRIIAGLSLGVLVVQAGQSSGALITAHYANAIGREIFAVPGAIAHARYQGCHALIKQGAKLTESLRDILDEFPLFSAVLPEVTDVALREKGETISGTSMPKKPSHIKKQQALKPPQNIQSEALSFDQLCLQMDGDAAKTNALLLEWELKGQLIRLPEGKYLVSK